MNGCSLRPARGRAALAAVLSALTLALLGWAAAAGGAEEPVRRLHAEDAVSAAVAASGAAFPDGAGTALLGQDGAYADVLAASLPNGLGQRPLLLTPRAELDPRTADELERLGVERVEVLGGPAAVDDAVLEDLRDRGYGVGRVSGPTRVDTAVALAARFAPDAGEALIARAWPAPGGDAGQAAADALAAGPLATALRAPVLLTATEALSDATREHLRASSVRHVRIIGGPAAVSEAVIAELAQMGIGVQRIAGRNRFGTAVAVAEALSQAVGRPMGAPGTAGIGEGSGGSVHASALPATAWFAAADAPVLLVAGNVVPMETAEYLAGARALRCAGLVTYTACDEAAIAAGLRSPHVLEPSEPFNRAALSLADDRTGGSGGRVVLDVYDAATGTTRARGLMEREWLHPEAGMIFRFRNDSTSGFWMKNTKIPLSIAFADSGGTILRIMDMEPCTTDPCPIYSPGVRYRDALEVNQGWFDRRGVDVGWRLAAPSDLPPPR